jgi:hypothetical protein
MYFLFLTFGLERRGAKVSYLFSSWDMFRPMVLPGLLSVSIMGHVLSNSDVRGGDYHGSQDLRTNGD